MSLAFNGTSQFLRLLNNTLGLAANNVDDITLVARFKRSRTSTADPERILSRGYTDSSTTYHAIEITTGNLVRGASYFVAGDTSEGHLVTDTTTWHIAVCRMSARDGTGPQALVLNLDGTNDTPDTGVRTNTGTFNGLFVSKRTGSLTTGQNQFGGKICEIAVYRGFLSEDQIDELETKEASAITFDDTVGPEDLVAYFRLYDSLVSHDGLLTFEARDGGNPWSPTFDTADHPTLTGSGGGGPVTPLEFIDDFAPSELTGTGFGVSGGRLILSPSNVLNHPDEVQQEVFSWSDTLITFRCARGKIPADTNAYLLVEPAGQPVLAPILVQVAARATPLFPMTQVRAQSASTSGTGTVV